MYSPPCATNRSAGRFVSHWRSSRRASPWLRRISRRNSHRTGPLPTGSGSEKWMTPYAVSPVGDRQTWWAWRDDDFERLRRPPLGGADRGEQDRLVSQAE